MSYFIWVKTIFGSNLVTKNAQIQLKVKAIEVPKDLNSGENSSTFIVQAKGPIPVRKKNTIKSSIAVSRNGRAAGYILVGPLYRLL